MQLCVLRMTTFFQINTVQVSTVCPCILLLAYAFTSLFSSYYDKWQLQEMKWERNIN